MNDNPNLTYVRWAVAALLAIAALVAVFLQNHIASVINTSMAVQIPEIVATAISVGIIALLTAGFAWLFKVFGMDLSGLAPVIGLAISTWIVAQLQGLINIVPTQFDPFLNAFFYLLTILLAPAGLLYITKGRDTQPHQLL
jgi:hypothetical protein